MDDRNARFPLAHTHWGRVWCLNEDINTRTTSPELLWESLVTVLHGEARNEETRIDINSRLYFYTEVDRHRWGLRYRYTVDINNNPQQTWGRTDYIKGDITGNTWDTIKTQTKTNQLMMGNRKDHIRVRRQRQRKTKSDTLNERFIWVKLSSNHIHTEM